MFVVNFLGSICWFVDNNVHKKTKGFIKIFIFVDKKFRALALVFTLGSESSFLLIQTVQTTCDIVPDNQSNFYIITFIDQTMVSSIVSYKTASMVIF